MDFLASIRNFDFSMFIDYFLSTYYSLNLVIAVGLYMFISKVKHPTKNGWDSSPLQENWKGVLGGIGLFVLGCFIIYWRLADKDYPWFHNDIKNPTWEKYTAITILILSLGRLVYLFFFENLKEIEKFRFIIVLVSSMLLLVTGVWGLLNVG